MSELKETKKKVFAQYEQTSKQFEPDPNPKNTVFAPKKPKKRPLNQMKLKATQKTKVVAKQFEPDPNPQNSLFLAPKSQKEITLKLD